jgi:hypothetical protein
MPSGVAMATPENQGPPSMSIGGGRSHLKMPRGWLATHFNFHVLFYFFEVKKKKICEKCIQLCKE